MKSKRVIECEELGLTFENHGGHGVNVYNREGDEVDFFNIGDFSKSSVSVEEFEEAVEDEIKWLKGEYEDD